MLGAELVNATEHFAQSVRREKIEHLGRGTDKRQLAATTHADDFVTKFCHVRQGVRDHDDGHPVIGQASQQAHDFPVGALVQTAGDLVEQQQARTAEDLGGQACAFLLPAAERADTLVKPIKQVDAARGVVHRRAALLGGGIGRQPKSRRVVERLAERELLMQDILLRNECNILLQGLKIGVQVTIIEQHRAFVRKHPTGHDVHQRGLA